MSKLDLCISCLNMRRDKNHSFCLHYRSISAAHHVVEDMILHEHLDCSNPSKITLFGSNWDYVLLSFFTGEQCFNQYRDRLWSIFYALMRDPQIYNGEKYGRLMMATVATASAVNLEDYEPNYKTCNLMIRKFVSQWISSKSSQLIFRPAMVFVCNSQAGHQLTSRKFYRAMLGKRFFRQQLTECMDHGIPLKQQQMIVFQLLKNSLRRELDMLIRLQSFLGAALQGYTVGDLPTELTDAILVQVVQVLAHKAVKRFCA
ncbi:hypothetical protein HDE_04255 [Halotydeus destructor]|nr:hypothetical protein HDE_04255 [Halotydeus destructor]